MAQKTALEIAVVGRNVSGALVARALCERLPSCPVTWYPTASESQAPVLPSLWIPTTSEFRAELGEACPAVRARPWIFLNGARRVSAKDFVAGHSDLAAIVHPAVRRKLVALAFFGDASPGLWSSRGEPDAGWVDKAPESFARGEIPEDMWLLRRDDVLAYLESSLREAGAQVAPLGCGVFGLEPRATEGHRLVHNAPFGTNRHDRVIWVQPTEEIKEEGARRPGLKAPRSVPRVQWEIYVTELPARAVVGLPPLSAWLLPEFSEEFLETGHLPSGALNLVLCRIDSETSRAWLQVHRLVWPGSPPRETFSPAFLHRLCPRLVEAPPLFEERTLAEPMLGGFVTSRWESLGHGVEACAPSVFGGHGDDVGRWISRGHFKT